MCWVSLRLSKPHYITAEYPVNILLYSYFSPPPYILVYIENNLVSSSSIPPILRFLFLAPSIQIGSCWLCSCNCIILDRIYPQLSLSLAVLPVTAQCRVLLSSPKNNSFAHQRYNICPSSYIHWWYNIYRS